MSEQGWPWIPRESLPELALGRYDNLLSPAAAVVQLDAIIAITG